MNSQVKLTISWAQTIDSYLKLPESEPYQNNLSCAESLLMTHWLRSIHDALLVGVGTVLADNPRLNCRLEEFEKRVNSNTIADFDKFKLSVWPARFDHGPSPSKSDDAHPLCPIILDSWLRTPEQSKCLNNSRIFICFDETIKFIYDFIPKNHGPKVYDCWDKLRYSFNNEQNTVRMFFENDPNNKLEINQKSLLDVKAYYANPLQLIKKFQTLSELSNITLLPCPAMYTRNKSAMNQLDLDYIFKTLSKYYDIKSIMIEGGDKVLSTMLKQKYSLEIILTICPVICGAMADIPAQPRLNVLWKKEKEGNSGYTRSGEVQFMGVYRFGQDIVYHGIKNGV